MSPRRATPIRALLLICLTAASRSGCLVEFGDQTARCGDGILDPDRGEECDDGNSLPGDGCSATCRLEVVVETACDDNLDNDADGAVDCDDPDCQNAANCRTSESRCADGLDNDGDGSLDCADPDCEQLSCGPNGQTCDEGVCRCPGGRTSESDCHDQRDEDCDGFLDCADPDCRDDPGCPRDPRNIYTWLAGPGYDSIYSYDVDLRIDQTPGNPQDDQNYQWALSVTFTDGAFAHGALQLWGGSRQAYLGGDNLVGGVQVHTIDYPWVEGRWFRFRFWVLQELENGSFLWGFWVMDYDTAEETNVGTISSWSDRITGAVVFTLTDNGVQCETPANQVTWRAPGYNSRTAGNGLAPDSGRAGYNGTCLDPNNTEQYLDDTAPITFVHRTNATRTTPDGALVFGE